MKAICLVTLLVIGLATFTITAQVGAQHGHSTEDMHGMESSTQEHNTGKARCAYDGMMMKTSAMVPMKHGDEMLYFCNGEQKTAFQKNPERYLKKVTIGSNIHAFMNVLTMKEYMDMMRGMGMGKMAKMKNPNNTHRLSIYLADEPPEKLAGITVKVIAPDGKVSFHGLEYDKMMKSYVGSFSFLDSTKYKVSVLLESPEIGVL
jgi:YHS domain-containing protein